MALNAFFSPYVIVRKDAKSKLHDDLQSLLLSIVQTYYQDGLFKYITIYAELMKFLCVLGENMVTDALDTPVAYVQESDESERTATTRAHMTAIYECCVYLRDHSREDISLDDLARQSGFSKFYFSRLFKEFTGMSFVDYLNRSRIMDAEALLVDPDSVITDVALLVGFNSISTFNRVFRKLKGTTPTAFKQMAMQSGYAGRLS